MENLIHEEIDKLIDLMQKDVGKPTNVRIFSLRMVLNFFIGDTNIFFVLFLAKSENEPLHRQRPLVSFSW